MATKISVPPNCWACPVNGDCDIKPVTKCPVWKRFHPSTSAYDIMKRVFYGCWPKSAVDNEDEE